MEFKQMIEDFRLQGLPSSKEFIQDDEAVIEDLSYDLTENMKEYSEKLEKNQILESTLIALDNMSIIPSGSTQQLLSVIEVLNINKDKFLQTKRYGR